MRRLLKLLHTLGAAGLIGAMAALFVLSRAAPPPSSLAAYAATREAMAAVSTWLFLPSLVVTLMAGLIAIAVTRAFHDAGWAWLKLLTGLSLFEGGLQTVQGPMRDEADRAASILAGHTDPTALGASLGAEQATLCVLLVVALANVVLGIWRPRLIRLPERTTGSGLGSDPASR